MSDNLVKQQALEKAYEKNVNAFYNTIKFLLENQEDLSERLKEIDVKDMNIRDYELLGGISYLVGLDFISQTKFDEKVISNVKKRLKECGVNNESVVIYLKKIMQLKNLGVNKYESKLQEINEKQRELINKDIFFPTSMKLVEKNIRLSIRKLIKNSLLPVNMSIGTDEILSKPKWAYHDILKINSLINKQLSYMGLSSVSVLTELQSNQTYLDILQKAMKYFDAQKYGVIYLDAIISLIEIIDVKFPYDEIVSILTGDFFEFDMLEFDKNEYQESDKEQEDTTPEIFKGLESFKIQDDAYASELMENDKNKFLEETLKDYIKYDIQTPEQFEAAIDHLVNNADYAQHIYKFIRASIKSVDFVESEFATKLADLMKNKIDTYRGEYKAIAELLFRDIDDVDLPKITKLVNELISELVLESDEQKQYLISQLIENQIKTYNHLQQLLSMIESCKIKGSGYLTYVNLYKYLQQQTIMDEIFDETKAMPELENKITFYQAFRDWYTKRD